MPRISPPTVKVGQGVTAAIFAAMERAVRAVMLRAGPGVRLKVTPNGTFISFDAGAASFAHAWDVTLQDNNSATVRPGTINAVPATIKGVPLDGGSEDATPPVLSWAAPMVDDNGRGYICAEVTYLPADKWAVGTVEIVQVADPDTPNGDPSDGLPNATGGSLPLPGNRARHPLAMLILRDSGKLDVEPVTFFPLTTRTKFAADGVTPAKHFFYQ